jgi:DNA-binding protein H-NS
MRRMRSPCANELPLQSGLNRPCPQSRRVGFSPVPILPLRRRDPQAQGTLIMLKEAKIITFPQPKVVVGSMVPKKSSLDNLSNQALCKLRDEIAEVLKSRAESLQREIDRLVGPTSTAHDHRRGLRKGQKIAPKYQGPHGEKWSGRGLKPRWLTAAMSEGKRLEDFLIDAPKKNGMPKKNSLSEACH